MSSAQERDLPPARLDLVEESRTFGYDGSDWVALAVDQNGQLDVTLEAESVSLEGDDDDGNTLAVNVETLSEGIADPDGLLTYLARALNSQAQDELVSRVTDSAGTQVDPATTALEAALQANAADEYRTRVFGPDAGGTLQAVLAEAFDTALSATDVGLVTYGDRALRSIDEDWNQVVIHGLGAGGSIQEVGVEAFDSGASQSGFALLTYGDRALQSQADDELRTIAMGFDATGVNRIETNAEQFDTALATTDVGLATYGDRALASIAQDEWVARTADSAGDQQDLQQTDSAFHDGTAIAAGGTATTALAAPGASKLRGRVVNDAQYDVDIEVLDAPGGTVLFTVNVATDVAGNTETPLDEPLESPYINVVVTNDGGAQSAMTAAYHLVGGN